MDFRCKPFAESFAKSFANFAAEKVCQIDEIAIDFRCAIATVRQRFVNLTENFWTAEFANDFEIDSEIF